MMPRRARPSQRDSNVCALYFNNLGCIHHSLRKHALASVYFEHALRENGDVRRATLEGRAHL